MVVGVSDVLLKNQLLHGEDELTVCTLGALCTVKGEAQKSPLFWRFSGGS